MPTSHYVLSFTAAGSLLQTEMLTAAERYLLLSDWQALRQAIMDENLLQARTASTSKRLSSEIINRLQQLSERELKFLVKANPQDQKYLLWLAICRCYRFIREFAIEELHERFITLQIALNYEDYDYFYTKKSMQQEKLANLSDSTQAKIRQVVFKMLRDAELLTKNNMITPALLSSDLAKLMAQHNADEFRYFPIFEADVARLLQ